MTVRYSDEKLEAFKVLIDQKLEEARIQLENLQTQIIEISENTDDEFGTDWMDDSSTSGNLEMLNNMAIRQRKFIQDLQNALLRIKNKTYGICTITGELIAEERLKAVPTTTKSLVAKDTPASAAGRVKPTSKSTTRSKKKEEEAKKVITKMIKPATATSSKSKPVYDEDDDLEGFDDLDNFDDDNFDGNDNMKNSDFSDGEDLDD